VGDVVVRPVIAREMLPAVADSDFLSFYSEFDRRLDDLKDALARSKNAQALAAALKGRGGFQNFVGSVTGRNDMELADMVGELGAGMEITQGILQMVMQVQNTKNQHLRIFHKSLVDKIADLQNDSAMLDLNQREAAIAIVSELSDQIRAQLEQQEILESHQEKLEHLGRFAVEAESLSDEQREKILVLESKAVEANQALEHQQRRTEALRNALIERDKQDRSRNQRIDAQAVEVKSLKLEVERLGKTIRLLGQGQGALADQLGRVENGLTGARSFGSIVLQSALPLLSIVISVVSLVCALR